ncbi:tyrosine-protein phosphatase [Streptomyces sp. YC504]|uniref:Tyrosine-protein phosphatase n=1 Tax=Streptomyces mesophilus TaxID=1775132 RepID=A0A6G4XQE8_9ACTN|nr:tyrosine-protein phosphatase [Streptomyces mesophilus]NGO79422.1 tyrosine-protein phosphatase [Streptomyces mesophilus]
MKISSVLPAAVALTLTGLTAAPAATAHDHSPRRATIPFTQATVTAAEDGSYVIEWKAPGVRQVAVEANGRTVARGGSSGKVTVRGLHATDRQWFTLDADRGRSLRLADRLIALEGTVNFRDAGGYRTADGHWVKMGEIYRSDSLDKLTEDDLAKLRRLGIRTVFDLRMEQERTDAPDKVPAGATYTVADVFAGSGSFTSMPKSPDEAERMMVDAEKTMVSGSGAKAAYTKVFDGFTDRSGGAVLFHCTAGKDRTGWSNAALLTALGVPRDTVMADYLASNTYRAEANDQILTHLPPTQAAIYKPLLDVRPEYLNSGFDEITRTYGSFGTYLKDATDVSKQELRELKRELLVG